MNILSHIKHYLTDEGKDFFPRWFEEASEIIQTQPGFVQAKYAYENDCVHVWVEFHNEENLLNWASSDLHSELVSKLDKFRTKSLSVQRYCIETATDDIKYRRKMKPRT